MSRNPSAFAWDRAWLDHRDYLPHFRQENAVYFITFRLNDSLPAERVKALRQKRDAWLTVNPLPHTLEQEMEYRRIWTVKIENLLDAGYGACVLRDPECRRILEATLRHDDGTKYHLGEFVIMPNHLHALVHLRPGNPLCDTIKAWKSISARRIGKQLSRQGSYWMDEYFDHIVRDDESLDRYVRYIRKNPTHLPPDDFTLGSGTLKVPPVPPPAE